MHIDVITTIEEFGRVRPNWEAVYAADPESQYFLSWSFLSSYLLRSKGAWFILAARTGPAGSPYVGFFPLRMRGKISQKTGLVTNEINMAGSYSADYTGIVVEPEHQRKAVLAFCRHLRTMHWSKIHLENLRMSERRSRQFFEALKDPRYTVTPLSRFNRLDKVDNALCPIVDLHDSFEEYLEEKVGSSTRQKMRRFLRKVENSDTLRITDVTAETLTHDIEALLALWRTRWAERKGKNTPGIINSNRALLKNAFASGHLKLPVLWDGERVAGALGFFLDPVKKQMLFHIAGRDGTYENVPSGLVLHAYAIRWGIENGYRFYDFMRGDEAYKFTFGARSIPISSYIVQTTTKRNLGDAIHPSWIGAAFAQASRSHAAGQLAKAQNAYRQILHSQPGHVGAHYGLGQIATQNRNFTQAADHYRRLVEMTPNALKAWLRLALTYQAAENHVAAVDAFRKVVELDPDLANARYCLARSLAYSNRIDEAFAIYRELLSSSDLQLRLKVQKQIGQLQMRQQIRVLARQPEGTRTAGLGPRLRLAAAALGTSSLTSAVANDLPVPAPR